MKLVSMKRSPKRTLSEAKEVAMPEPMAEEKYPYGLKIHLCDEDLAKLGVDVNDYSVDDPIMIHAKATICEVSSREYQEYGTGDTKYDQRLELQITAIALDAPMAQAEGAGKHLRGLLQMIK